MADSETILRGSKMRIYPTQRQAQQMDLWRRRCMQLWNLLLSLEQAAYSGENTRSKLGWRSIWAQVLEESYTTNFRAWEVGKTARMGKSKGKVIPPRTGPEPLPPEPVMLAKIRREGVTEKDSPLRTFLKRGHAEDEALKADPDARYDLTDQERDCWAFLDTVFREAFPGKTVFDPFEDKKLRAAFDEACDAHGKEIDSRYRKKELNAAGRKKSKDDLRAIRRAVSTLFQEADDRLFMWEHELQKIMARLKQVPRTEWIGDLPSHAAQAVVKDLIKALQAMLRERKKRVSGAGGRDTGFPKFKKNRYASGSVYFANTQLKFEQKKGAPGRKTPKGGVFAKVKLPNGVGWMECRINAKIGEAFEYGEADLMGGRIWRQGEDWYLSCQWKVPKPLQLESKGHYAAVKIAAAIPITVYDDRGRSQEYHLPPIDEDLLGKHAFVGRAQSRTLEARKKRCKKREAYRRKRDAQKLERGIAAKDARRARVPLTPGFYKAAAKLAKLEGEDRDKRDEWLHQTTTKIIRMFDIIAVQKMEVARMMKKPRPAETEEEQKQPKEQGKRRSLKAARVMMRRTAMARIQQTLKYKALDLRGEGAYEELDALYPTVQPCSRCGVIHPEMKDGKPTMRCAELLPDGTLCGNHLARNKNAVRIVARELRLRLEQRKEVNQ